MKDHSSIAGLEPRKSLMGASQVGTEEQSHTVDVKKRDPEERRASARVDAVVNVFDAQVVAKTSSDLMSEAGLNRDGQNLLNPQIPEGKYIARCIEHRVYKAFSDLKLTLDFRIIGMGHFFGTKVSRHYSVLPIRRKGGFKPRTKTCVLVVDWFRAHPDTPGNIRLDRLPMTRWLDGEYEILVGDVVQNHRQQKLPEQVRYSVVREVLGRV